MVARACLGNGGIMAQVRSPRRRIGRLSIVAAALALVAAACGSGDDPETTPTTTLAAVATTAPTTTAPPPTTTVAQSTTTTHVDSDIPATATTVMVQTDLTFLGYFEGVIDGIAGPITQEAISAFQEDAGIEVDGVYGPQTDAAMATTLEGNEEYVTDLQEFLIDLKLYSGPADGDYGAGTEKAVKAFQKDCEVEETGSLDMPTRLCRAAT